MIPRYFITTAKFLVYSFFFTKATHRMIREMEYEHDPIYNWEDLIMYGATFVSLSKTSEHTLTNIVPSTLQV